MRCCREGIRNAINMPSVDPKDLESLTPYLDLCHRLGAFARQAAKGSVESIKILFLVELLISTACP